MWGLCVFHVLTLISCSSQNVTNSETVSSRREHACLFEQSMHAFHFRSKVRSDHHRRRRCCCRCCATPVLSSPSIPSSLFSSSSCQYFSSTSSSSHTLFHCTLFFLFRSLDPLVSIYTVVLVFFIVLSIFSINVFLISHTLSLHSLFRWVMIAFDHFRPVSWCCHLSPYPMGCFA